MDHDTLLAAFDASRGWVHNAVADVPDADMAWSTPVVPNHPAWTLSHLSVAIGFTLGLLDAPSACPSEWRTPAAPGSTPQPDRSLYADKATLLDVFARQHAHLADAVRAAPAGTFARETPEHLRAFFPTLGHITTFMLASHTPYHVAQLMDWRRAWSSREAASAG